MVGCEKQQLLLIPIATAKHIQKPANFDLMEAPAADDDSAAAEIEAAPAGEGAVAAAGQAPAEPTAEPTAEATAQAAPSSGAEEKPKTLLQALGDQSNRNLAVTRRMDSSMDFYGNFGLVKSLVC